MDTGDNWWVVAVNLVIWGGIFLYLLSLHRRLKGLERASEKDQ